MRLNIKLSDELGQKVKLYSTKFGMSKSSFIAYAVGSHVQQLESQANMLEKFTNNITNIAKEELVKNDNDPTDYQPNNN